MRRAALGIGIAIGVYACASRDVFTCKDDAQCVDGGIAGLCEDDGYCSFLDSQCDSGRRYGSHAPSNLAGECVPPDGTSAAGDDDVGDDDDDDGDGVDTFDVTGVSSDSASTSNDPSDPSTSDDGSTCPADWLDCGFAYRRRLVVSAMPDAQVTDFPVLVRLMPAAFDHAHAAADGSDIRFFSVDGDALPHEVERFGANAESALWVRLPSVGVDPQAEGGWMYYGSDAPPPAPDPRQVWSNGFVAVWHLGDGADALAAFPLQSRNATVADGRIAEAQAFDGMSARMTVQSDASLDPFATGGTITAWIHPQGWGIGDLGRIADARDAPTDAPGWSFAVDGIDDTLRFSHMFTVSQGAWQAPANAIALGQWAFVSVSFDRSNPESPAFAINGLPVETTAALSPSGQPVHSSIPFALGANAGADDRHFDGRLDEVRVANVVRSPAWLAYEHATVTDNLVSLGLEESP